MGTIPCRWALVTVDVEPPDPSPPMAYVPSKVCVVVEEPTALPTKLVTLLEYRWDTRRPDSRAGFGSPSTTVVQSLTSSSVARCTCGSVHVHVHPGRVESVTKSTRPRPGETSTDGRPPQRATTTVPATSDFRCTQGDGEPQGPPGTRQS